MDNVSKKNKTKQCGSSNKLESFKYDANYSMFEQVNDDILITNKLGKFILNGNTII